MIGTCEFRIKYGIIELKNLAGNVIDKYNQTLLIREIWIQYTKIREIWIDRQKFGKKGD